MGWIRSPVGGGAAAALGGQGGFLRKYNFLYHDDEVIECQVIH